jgi:hypothetical protein
VFFGASGAFPANGIEAERRDGQCCNVFLINGTEHAVVTRIEKTAKIGFGFGDTGTS